MGRRAPGLTLWKDSGFVPQTPSQHLQQPAEPGARKGQKKTQNPPQMFYCNLGSSPPPLRRKFYISLNFKPSLQNCQFTSPASKTTPTSRLLPAPRTERGSGDAGGGPVLQQEIFLQPPPSRCSSPPPSKVLPAAPQPGAAGSLISQASPNSPSLRGLLLRQEKTGRLLSRAALWGAPIHLFKQISKRAAALSSPLSSPGLTMG